MNLRQMSDLERVAFLLEHLFGLRVFPSWTAKEREPEAYPFAVYDRKAIKDACEFIRVYHPHNRLGGGAPWAPYLDLDQAFEVEDALEDRGLLFKYVAALRRVIRSDFVERPTDGDLWLLIHAPAVVRVEAACLVVTESKAR